MCPTVSKMGVRMQQVSSWCARWRILRCGDLTTILQLQNECTGLRNDTCVPNGGFTTAKHPAKWGFGYEIGSFYALWFRSRFAAAKWGYCAAKWHSCAKRGFRSCENFCKGVCWAAKSFRSRGPFSQPTLDFAAGTEGLRNHFAANGHFRRGLIWAAKFRRPLKFLRIWAPFGSLRPSFIFFAISPTKDHSKRWSYI